MGLDHLEQEGIIQDDLKKQKKMLSFSKYKLLYKVITYNQISLNNIKKQNGKL